MTTTQFRVPGMTCGHCEGAVTAELTKLDGVTKVDVDLDSKTVVVESSTALTWESIVESIDEAGFEAVRG